MYKVTIYNQHAACGIWAEGRSKPKAFAAAMKRAGAEHIREGEDKSRRDHSAVAHKLFRDLFRDFTRRTHALSMSSHTGISLRIERVEAANA